MSHRPIAARGLADRAADGASFPRGSAVKRKATRPRGQGSPYTVSRFTAPTKTVPSATVGTANLTPRPGRS
jgi:hypothetical protein